MKKSVLLSVLLLSSLSAFAADDCVPIHQSSPVSFEVSAKNGVENLHSLSQVAAGNARLPKEMGPADKLSYTGGAINFYIIPVSSCKNGVLVDFEGFNDNKQQLLPWGKATVITGKKGADLFVEATATKVKK